MSAAIRDLHIKNPGLTNKQIAAKLKKAYPDVDNVKVGKILSLYRSKQKAGGEMTAGDTSVPAEPSPAKGRPGRPRSAASRPQSAPKRTDARSSDELDNFVEVLTLMRRLGPEEFSRLAEKARGVLG